ncbi:hypothetical protein SAMD00019534_126770 [Acytostelium subglobosum LB1]|uniref:hypothetical protein n=1 Tax=Acytostelium subglobosum LB1 TaxID=1410327 RepID=UPI0006450A31|nr:hypothetical protein SAMD00019534_126770 [Acytostelium subglobosum LB1]GAM29501.1 hypothetical protein SAMD00019534_126770 [Acytostelium subglobosum LB1]|eukprot:XP_012747551.1 hypothetical protein SAMD00019534_126770 [Acytostelium subglobosum LB1]
MDQTYVPLTDLSQLKDELQIPDAMWMRLRKTFKLSKKYSLSKVKQIQTGEYHWQQHTFMKVDLIADLVHIPPETIRHICMFDKESRKASYATLRSLIDKALDKERPNLRPGEKLYLKISFDGCALSKTMSVVIGTIQLMYESKRKRRLRSPFDNLQFLVYEGKEDYDQMRSSLSEFCNELKTLMNRRVDSFDFTPSYSPNSTVTIYPVIVVDMACLICIMGIYACYKTNSTYRCCWCSVTKHDLADFNFDGHDLRDVSQMHASSDPGNNEGCRHDPIFKFMRMTLILPDTLHLLMSQVKLMTKMLLLSVNDPRFGREVLNHFKSIGITMRQMQPNEDILTTFAGSRLNYEQCLKILNKKDGLLAIYKRYCNEGDEYADKVKLLWDQCYTLLGMCVKRKSKVTEQEWLEYAKVFGKNFVSLYPKTYVSSYMHVLVYHIGYFLEKYSNLDRFANFAIECLKDWFLKQHQHMPADPGTGNQVVRLL